MANYKAKKAGQTLAAMKKLEAVVNSNDWHGMNISFDL